MNPTEQLRFARQRYSAAHRALNAVRHKDIVGVGTPRMVRFGSTTTPVWDEVVDRNAAERARLCRRCNRLMRITDMIAQRHGLSLAL